MFTSEVAGTLRASANNQDVTRAARAIEVSPVYAGTMTGWRPYAAAAIYAAWHLASGMPVHRYRDPALGVGALYANGHQAPSYAVVCDDDVYPAEDARAATTVAAHLPTARILRLDPFTEALMTSTWQDTAAARDKEPYVVTYGLTRRLVEAENRIEARTIFQVEVGLPAGTTVGYSEIEVREASEHDIYEFYPRRNRNQLLESQGTLFDMPRVQVRAEGA